VKILLLTFSAALLFARALPASDAVWTRAVWAGGAGPEGGVINSDSPDVPPVASFEDGVTGRLSLRITRPRGGAVTGKYTAQLALHDGAALRTYRGSGDIAADGAITNTIWRSGSRGSAPILVNLQRPPADPDEFYLIGTATLESRIFPIFALPRLFDAQTNPLGDSVRGFFNGFARDPLAVLGTGVGAVTINRGGVVRLKATLGDLRPLTGSSIVLTAGDGRLFFIMTRSLARRGFFGGWFAFNPSDPESDWRGRARCPGSATPSLDLLFAAYRRPEAGVNMLPWSVGVFDADLPQVEGSVTRLVQSHLGWSNDVRLAAHSGPSGSFSVAGDLIGVNVDKARLLSFAIKPATGRAAGRMRYAYYDSPGSLLEKIRTTGLVGAVNQKAALIEGYVKPRVAGAASGLLLVSPPEE